MNIYQKRYNILINHYRNVNDHSSYTEKHHIIPKCLGGSDDSENIVKLPAKAHYLAHKILTKIYPNNNKIHFAFWCMSRTKSNGRKEFINAKRYASMKESLSIASKQLKRRPWTEEEKIRASKQRKGKKRKGEAYKNIVIAANKNLEKAKEANIKRSLAGEYFSVETRKKLSEQRKGKKFSKEHRQKISASKKKNTLKAQQNVARSYRLVSCLQCKKHMIYSNFMRWHNHQ